MEYVTYTLMQAPRSEGKYSSQIEIVNTISRNGREKMRKLLSMGYVDVGCLESNLDATQLKWGFEYDLQIKLDDVQQLLRRLLREIESKI